MSYDDGTVQDVRVMDLCRQYGLKCTFALNSCNLTGEFRHWEHLGQTVYLETCPAERIGHRYRGFEVAGHTYSHPDLRQVPSQDFGLQVQSCQKTLSDLTGYEVRGMTYPNNGYDDRVCENLKKCGVVYSRTTDATYSFDVPKDFLRWHPTAHDHDACVMDLIDTCIAQNDGKLKIFYLWGHAYEFDKTDAHCTEGGERWLDFESILQKVSRSRAFWPATNIEVYDYIMATRRLQTEKDRLTNPSDLPLYGLWNGQPVILPAKTSFVFQ